MATEEKYMPVLEHWQRNKFRPIEIPLVLAAKAARERRNEIVRPIQQGGKWIYVYKDTGLPALFTFAVQWSSNDNLLTGNFVPDGERAPDDVSPLNIANEKTMSRATITYSFDTSIDNSIYGHIKASTRALEDRVKDEKTFNTGAKPRVNWQHGNDPGNEYRVTYRLFNACFSRNYRPPTDKEKKGFHDWVVGAVTKPGQTRAMLNAPMPAYLSYREGQPLRSIFKCNPPTFRDGDVVVMTFRFGIFIGRKNWRPDIMPEEFIRVVKAETLQDGGVPSLFQWRSEDTSFNRLEANTVVAPIVQPEDAAMDDQEADEGGSDRDDSHSTLSQISAASMLRRASMNDADAMDDMDVTDDGELVDTVDVDAVEHVEAVKPGGVRKNDKRRKATGKK